MRVALWSCFAWLVVGFLVSAQLILNARADRPGIAAKPKPVTLSDLIETERARHKLPRGMIETVIDHETGGTWDPQSFDPERESSCYARARTDKERKACGSYGLMHVVCRLHWDSDHCDELTIPSIGLQRGAKRLGECYRRTGKNIRRTFACFNGSGRKAEVYANQVTPKFKEWSLG